MSKRNRKRVDALLVEDPTLSARQIVERIKTQNVRRDPARRAVSDTPSVNEVRGRMSYLRRNSK